jgi:hypothetical protein
MKRIIAALVGLAALIALAGCDATQASAQDKENAQQARSSNQQAIAQPLPYIPWSQMFQNLSEIEEANSTGTQTTSFVFNRASVDPIQVCASIGTPIPNTASLSNPQQVVPTGNYNAVTTGQKDPDGIYTPSSSSGTYVMCIGPDGKALPAYHESEVSSVFGPAHWDYNKHQIIMDGPASFKFTSHKGQ